MTGAEVEKWVQENRAANKERYFTNGIDYLFVTLPDNWIAVFEDDSGDFIPCIQAADAGKAKTWCNLREPLTVPVTFL
jgi:hypothetical protein